MYLLSLYEPAPCLRIDFIIIRIRGHTHGSFSRPGIHSFDPRNYTVQVVDDIQTVHGPKIYISVFPLLVPF